MEETFHINIDIRQTDTHYVTVSKTRLWPALLRFTKYIGKNPIQKVVSNGAGITIINNLAIIVEGFITDIIAEHLSQHETSYKPFRPDTLTWLPKKKIYNELFKKKIEEYQEYQSLEVLFLFRNNISHGRSHSEVSRTEIESGDKEAIESENDNYQKIRNYLIRKGLVENKETLSNFNELWNLKTAIFLLIEVESFLFSVVQSAELESNEAIMSELRTACLS